MSRGVAWVPHPGSQRAFLECPYWEVLYHGTRGPGKTDALLMDYAQHVGEGWGPSWRGILFRRTYKQLADVVARTKRWFPRIFPGCKYNGSDYVWTFPQGEQLLLRYMRVPDDYWEYHGHEYPWIGWEELTRWPTMGCYEMMLACSRSSEPGMPRKVRGTANPYGIGHNAVKRYFVDKCMPCGVHVTTNEAGQQLKRTHIFGDITENLSLMSADPNYIARLDAITEEALRKAWRHGDWDIVAGGAFDDVWDRKIHVVEPFILPASYHVDRTFDWGSASPFSVLWFAESDGCEFDPKTGRRVVRPGEGLWFPRGTLFAINEWYGGTHDEKGLRMSSKEIARGIKEREAMMEDRVLPGPADTQIFDDVPGHPSIAEDMLSEGVDWTRANKAPGTRVSGFELLRGRMLASKQRPAEAPGFYVFAGRCQRLVEHLPVLERDEKNIHDVDTDQPDHDYDGTRYRVLAGTSGTTVTEVV